MPKRLAIIASHVIQYQDPLFRLIAADPEIDLTVFFCSREGAIAYHDREMATTLRWDVDLLTGYRHHFLTNLCGGSEFFRHLNPGIVPALIRGEFDAVIFMLGWGSATALCGIVTCAVTGTPRFVYGDSSFPPPEEGVRRRIRAFFLRRLFDLMSGFMVSGKLNADYYAHYGADRSRFFLLPWAVDNARFERESRLTADEKNAMRERHGIAHDDIVFVYSAKLIPRKDPMALLRALEIMQPSAPVVVLYLGDGEMRGELERYANERGLNERVRFAGFVNQSELPKHYAIGDVFVLPSLVEPRGAVINEAMACGLPLIVTDRCGSIGDIVLEGENALIYPAGNAAVLARCIEQLARDGALRARMAARSREIISTWDYRRGVAGVKEMIRWLEEDRRA